MAQPQIPRQAWEDTASQAERLISEQSRDNSKLEVVRNQLAEQRDQAYKLATYKDVEVRALEAQLTALGPAPAEGGSEPEVIATRRESLEQALAVASGPIYYAEGAYERANLLIGEIDTQIRENTVSQWLSQSPTPLLPSRWQLAAGEFLGYSRQITAQFTTFFDDPEAKRQWLQGLPLFIAMILAASAFLARLQPWAFDRIDLKVEQTPSKSRALMLRLLATGLKLLFPALGTLGLTLGFQGFLPELASVRTLAAVLPAMLLYIVLSDWLGLLLFRPTAPSQRIIAVADTIAKKGKRTCLMLGGFLGLIILIGALKKDYDFSTASIAVLTLLAIICGSLLLWRLATLLSQAAPGKTEQEATGTAGKGVLATLTLLMKISSILSVVFVSIGYDNLARQAIIPMVMSMGLLAFAIVVYFGLLNLLSHIFADQEEAKQGLLSVFLVTLISLALAPLLALIWGARTTDIAEVWRLLSDGVAIGDARLSLNVVLTLLIVLFVGILLTRWLQYVLRHSVLPKTKVDIGARTALVTGTGYIGVTLAAIIAVSAAGLNLASLAVVAGALSVGIGFGLQTIVSNFVSGIILLIERPIKEGDWIEVSGYSGFVKKIAVRSTRIETFDLHDVVIPNSDLIAGTVKNMTLHSFHGRLIANVGVAYGSDLSLVKTILLQAAEEHPMVLSSPEPAVLFMEMADSALLFELRCYIRDIRQVFVVRSDLLFTLYETLTARGITIPFPQRDIHIKGLDESLRPTSPPDHSVNNKRDSQL
ncbi:mechanosensitive ion channel family protein [Photobacterium atrarenae]|uniref:Mechanosensitive ion channel n=1 Tax=Photobacterium atrarenae TaxID=865757 RepID=A0ABY5GFJ9_9GAMM|nr:mechanosensitive ion channel domain-containing protein [Photobacterium atrarenae]UTV27163.1 mechanosensitive ion channel [Photobacterium atrarenae]